MSAGQAYRVAHTLITGTHPPDGLVVAGDLASRGALAALHERGLAAPAAVAVMVVGLTMRPAQLGGATVFMLDIAGHVQAALALLADPRPGVTLVPNRLLPGATCDCPCPRR